MAFRSRGLALGAAYVLGLGAGCGRLGYELLVLESGLVLDGGTLASGGGNGSMAADSSVVGGSATTPEAGPGGESNSAETDSGVLSQCPERFSQALYCEGFEQGLGAQSTSELQSSGAVAISSERVFLGDFAFHASGGAGDVARVRVNFPSVSDGEIHARAYFYVPSTTALDETVVLLALHGSSVLSGNRVSADLQPIQRLGLAVTTADQTYSAPEGSLPLDEWFCLELTVQIDGSRNGTVALLLNGIAIAQSESGIDTLPETGFVTLLTGITESANTSSLDVYVDELVLDTIPIGCD